MSVSSRFSGRRPRNLGLIDCKQIRTAKQTLTITTLHQKKDLNAGRPVFCKGLRAGEYVNVDLYKVVHSLCVSRQAPRWLLSPVDYALSLHHSLIFRTVPSRLRCTYEPTHLVCVFVTEGVDSYRVCMTMRTHLLCTLPGGWLVVSYAYEYRQET